jgi:hypothetical protein
LLAAVDAGYDAPSWLGEPLTPSDASIWEIEYAAFLINSVSLNGDYGDKRISAPRIDMTWPFKGYPGKPDSSRDSGAVEPTDDPDWRADIPWRRSPQEIHSDLRRRFVWAQVMIPHALAVLLGAVLFFLAVLNTPGFEQLHP